eukprot:gnl/TRDRNA2_/TRDRNA2_169188_c1_seq1.p3 gnl/TRDRNA2_/TRDRNA2_169188_c1~~gnl/TRDRNA2_/TRDRNA2_169188_c1_seq1.p3  ORF type:complete len:177 (+),score=3.31 gnl/TRDRNA2_/TRDRNA2_169188_c1_seq1:121-651(+)
MHCETDTLLNSKTNLITRPRREAATVSKLLFLHFHIKTQSSPVTALFAVVVVAAAWPIRCHLFGAQHFQNHPMVQKHGTSWTSTSCQSASGYHFAVGPSVAVDHRCGCVSGSSCAEHRHVCPTTGVAHHCGCVNAGYHCDYVAAQEEAGADQDVPQAVGHDCGCVNGADCGDKVAA